MRDVTIEQLRTLRTVVEAGSFSAAARKLGRVQAAVSQSIDRLEAQLGLRLFDRSGRVPRLTKHGEAVVAVAGRVAGDVEALDELVASLKRGAETTLRIVVDVMFPTVSLVTFAKEFCDAHPTVDLVIFTEVLSAVTAHVREKRSTWGIAIEDADMKDLDQRPIADVRLVPVAAPTSAIGKHRGPIEAAALAHTVQVVLGEHRHDAEEREFSGDVRGILSPRRWRVVDLATKHAFIAAGLGWGHLPEHLVRDDLRDGKLVALDLEHWGEGDQPSLRRALVLVRRREAIMGPVAKWAQTRLATLCRRNIDPEPERPPRGIKYQHK